MTGIGFLVAVEAADEFGLGSILRGVLLAGFGVAGMLLGRAAGDAVDRFGRTPVIFIGIAICSVLVVALGFAPSALALGALWFAIGLGSALMWAGINVLTVEAVPGNRAGGTSVVSAFKFAGNAVAPVMWLPLYHADPRLGFLGAGHPGRDGRPLHRTAPHGTLVAVTFASIGDSFSSFFDAVGSFFSNLAGVAVDPALPGAGLLHDLPHAAGARLVPHPACRLSRLQDRVQAHLGRVLRGLRVQLRHPGPRR